MKTQLISIAAAALLVGLPAAQAHAAPNAEVREFLSGAAAKADAQLAASGVHLDGTAVKVRAAIGSDGRLNGLSVVETSGSRDTDAAVEASLKRLPVGYVPPAVAGRNVILTLGQPAIVQAKAR